MRVQLGRLAFITLALCAAFPGPAGCAGGGDTLLGLLPSPKEVEGWRTDGDHMEFEADNLWEYIDGAAEGFLAYDFRRLVVQDYVSESGGEVKLEIYAHGSPLMAFGIYAQHRDPSLTFYETGNEGFGDEYSLHFWKGAYYVRVNAFEKGEETERVMDLFARAVASRITDEEWAPPELAFFTAGGLVERSEKYLVMGVLGMSKLPPAFSAEYRLGEREGKLYLFPLESAASAREIFDWYGGELGMSGEELKECGGEPVWVKRGEDPYRGRVLLFLVRGWVGVVTGFSDAPELMDGLMQEAASGISARSRE